MNLSQNTNTDQELQQKYRDFETEALPHLDALYNFALKMTADSDEADDLVQETFLRAFRFFDKFEKGTNSKAWLFRIMKNTFINDYRKDSREPNKVDYDDIQNFYENIKASDVKTQHVEQDVFSSLLDDEVTKAISELPEDFRTVVILSDIEGFSYEEIADFVDCPVGTVRSRLHRARKMLFTTLYSYGKDKGYLQDKDKH
ncbi:MAG: sigma-70 family RNA polymerase sigma factor [Ignavibacteriales bacterium]|jgi:RNA polymerase sigma-70 factor (ECF subfamily)|nr:sigma-70 family RNA polymerase sigma factor [Melioribacteraceae bacterium]RJP60821.1 MAG: sigma-70 family RNA polymerase sigma factor [Ignavibacteriales bacterium]